ncbi:MAG TPA: glycerol-3-phosphate 1-O-acyltransferase PlsY [Deltaproteobacteria bacterium]|nr:glycerol-3-phosphate 1-O-acyltransferase PlsY [Deltaproteobacteria bacterium]
MVNIAPLTLFGLPIVSYLLGSIPWGLILTRRFSGIDVRRNGSGNIGATNVYRLGGARLAILTLAADILKGLIPVWLAVSITPESSEGDLFRSAVALAAVLGHLFPIYLRFKEGGKGIAVATGCFLVIAPVACTISIIAFILSVRLSNRVSLASLIASLLLPFTVWMTTGSVPLTGCAGIAAGLIIIRHMPNIKRLISGTEHKFRN